MTGVAELVTGRLGRPIKREKAASSFVHVSRDQNTSNKVVLTIASFDSPTEESSRTFTLARPEPNIPIPIQTAIKDDPGAVHFSTLALQTDQEGVVGTSHMFLSFLNVPSIMDGQPMIDAATRGGLIREDGTLLPSRCWLNAFRLSQALGISEEMALRFFSKEMTDLYDTLNSRLQIFFELGAFSGQAQLHLTAYHRFPYSNEFSSGFRGDFQAAEGEVFGYGDIQGEITIEKIQARRQLSLSLKAMDAVLFAHKDARTPLERVDDDGIPFHEEDEAAATASQRRIKEVGTGEWDDID
ncbi:hypothetical protein COT42_08465 [Candidatus Saganbacteria bacterium CG08_land_8_20_14_0_20_45_16]|uniref:Uncharacterized protein n=1 Tax=Candidatus Saganbacteria bacterium CG08_land_8_20_14_0_20_45_16 TaxID=2014293 RepID=A0A2H0XTP1_UNCSA|nr:MAG: hypothetical protein COT42_08465 [Candidatus Saganbacteria bacterium CG08_land_8_20_14_0_20_45_16]